MSAAPAPHHAVLPFPPGAEKHLSYPLEEATYLEVGAQDHVMLSYVLKFVSKLAASDVQSIRPGPLRQRGSEGEDEVGMGMPGMGMMMSRKGWKGGGRDRRKKEFKIATPEAMLGLGWHRFEHTVEGESKTVDCLFQRVGEPIADPQTSAPNFFHSLVLFVRGKSQQGFLMELCREAVEVSTSTSETRVALWRFHARQGYWGVSARPYARALSSVVLDAEVKQVLLDDLNWFLKDETYAFYGEHGIPYHRSYLLHGPPGTGKTSTIFALAGKFRRNVCFIQMDPAVTDEAFRTAMATVPAESVVVLEDIDALFNVHREKSETSALSFSGFLNALDGLGAPEDVVFMMTTNHPDRLDPAVLRPGRVDVKCEFKTMSREMAAEYFLTFYEDAGCAQRFADQVVNMLSSQQVTMAQLQSFFLACHRNGHDAEAAVKELKKYPFEATRRQPMETMY